MKMSANKWWDGYDNNEDVIIDDYRCNFCCFAELLRLCDRYPMKVEVKCGVRQFVAKRLYITTTRSPRDTWAGRSSEDLTQLLRRIEHVVPFGDIPETPVNHAFNFIAPDL